MNAKNVLELIGNTPMVEIRRLNPNPNVQLYVKLEKCNPGGSVKDRIAKYMIEEAEKSGQLTGGKTVIEPTSGSKRLKEHNPAVKVIGIQPESGTAIQGLKDLKSQYVPAIWNPTLVDEIYYVNPNDAEEASRLLALQEGIFVGPSSGAIFHIAAAKAREIEKGVMVAIAPDGGEKYLSTTLCDPILCLECVKKYGLQCSYSDGRPIVKGDTSALGSISS